MNASNTYKQLTSFKTYAISLAMGILGIILVLIADLIDWKNHLSIQTLFRDFGSLLIASVAIAVIWELFSKRAFYAEAISASKLVDDITTTGLIGVSARWNGKVDWQRLFRSTNTIHILFIYGRTWRNTHHEELMNFAARANTRAVIVLPDPEDDTLLSGICQRMETDAQELRNRIIESKDEFIEVFNRDGNGNQKLEIWYIPFSPVYSYYCFGEKAIFTIYQHRLERLEVPTFVIESGGTLFEFFRQEFESITEGENSRGRRIFPES
jgi:hypothetical protein